MADQAHLHGILGRLRDLGAVLLYLHPVDSDGTADPHSDPPSDGSD